MLHPARLLIGLICQCQFHLLSPVPVEKAGEQPLASGDSVAETIKSSCQVVVVRSTEERKLTEH